MKVIKLSATPSTNAFMKGLLSDSGLVDETVIRAVDQTSGKGQQGTTWYSVPGQSLTISLFRRFDRFPARYQNYLNLAISIGVCRALSELGILDLAVKWPNDILSDGKKLCGILVENQLEGSKLASSIIGIGLNVNEAHFPDLPRATSMRLVRGTQYDLNEVFDTLVSCVFSEIRELNATTLSDYQQAYDALLFRRNTPSEFERPDGSRFHGVIQGIDSQGRLLVAQHGDVEAFQPKQIRLLY